MLRHFVPRQLQQTTWLTSTGYCRSKHTHTQTRRLFRYKPPLVPDTVYARLDGGWGSQICKFPGNSVHRGSEVPFSSFWRHRFFWLRKTQQRLLNTKSGREVGDSFCKWCTELCFHEFFKWSVYLFLPAENYTFCSFIKLILIISRCCWSGFRKIHLKKTTIMFCCCKHVFCRDTGGCVYLLVVNPSRTSGCDLPASKLDCFTTKFGVFFPETQVHPQNVWERYFSILVRAPKEILGRGWWVLVVDGWSKGVHGFPFLGLKNEIGDVFWTLFAALDGFVSWTSRKLYDFPILVRFNEVDVMIIQPKVLIAGLVLFSSFISSITVRGYRAKSGGSSWIR